MTIAIACGLPRSGSTLQYNIMRCLVEHNYVGRGIGWLPDKKLVGFLKGENSQQNENQTLVVKAQSISKESISIIVDNSIDVLCMYSCRDPRDAVHSMLRKFDYSFEKCIKLMDKSLDMRSLIIGAGIKLIDQPYSILRYDLGNAIDDLAVLLGITCTLEIKNLISEELNVAKARDQTMNKVFRFEALRRFISGRLGTTPPLAVAKQLYHANHVSAELGESGQWRFTLTPEQADYLMNRYVELVEIDNQTAEHEK